MGDIDLASVHGERLRVGIKTVNNADWRWRLLVEMKFCGTSAAKDIGGPVVDYGSLHSISIGSLGALGHGSIYQFAYT